MSIHIEPNGAYASCSDQSCKLPIHLPLDTVEVAQSLPYRVILQLIEVFDPPDNDVWISEAKTWKAALPGTPKWSALHRDYDLPAIIRDNGSMEWRRHGLLHRDGGKPASIGEGGTVQYWVNGVQVNKDGSTISEVAMVVSRNRTGSINEG